MVSKLSLVLVTKDFLTVENRSTCSENFFTPSYSKVLKSLQEMKAAQYDALYHLAGTMTDNNIDKERKKLRVRCI